MNHFWSWILLTTVLPFNTKPLSTVQRSRMPESTHLTGMKACEFPTWKTGSKTRRLQKDRRYKGGVRLGAIVTRISRNAPPPQPLSWAWPMPNLGQRGRSCGPMRGRIQGPLLGTGSTFGHRKPMAKSGSCAKKWAIYLASHWATTFGCAVPDSA